MSDDSGVILVVDDEPLDVDLIRRVLAGGGFQVLDADSYDSALRVFDEAHSAIDLVLVDVSLPGKNGVELAKELVKRKPSLRILFVSGHVGFEVVRFYGMRTSDRHFLQKPFRSEVLLARVRETLQSSELLPWAETEPAEEGGETAAKAGE
jgi:two-component system cell cycle sensor histidine kinase/response regulator CckA